MNDEHQIVSPPDEVPDVRVSRPSPGQDVDTLTRELTNANKNIQKLTEANAKWDTYTHQLKNDHEQELLSVAKDLKSVKESNKEFVKQLQESEVQKDKAVKLAIQQTQKIDDLKLKLHEQKKRSEAAEARNKFLEKAIETLRRDIAEFKSNRPVPMDTSSEAEASQRKIKSLEDEILVLQEQLKVFKGDFDQERRDREHAQSEIDVLQVENIKVKERVEKLGQTVVQREREIAKLKEEKRQALKKCEQLNQKLQQKSKGRVENSHYNVHINTRPEGSGSRNSPSHDRKPPADGLITDGQKRQIRENWTQFLNYMRLDDLLPMLFSVGVISLMEKEEIESKATSYQRNEYFLSACLLRGTQSDLRHFKSALIDSYQKHLAELVPYPPPTRSEPPVRPQSPTRPDPMDVAQEAWQCGDCTFQNSAESEVCQMCGKRNPLSGAMGVEMLGRGVDQCDNTMPQQSTRYSQDDVEED